VCNKDASVSLMKSIPTQTLHQKHSRARTTQLFQQTLIDGSVVADTDEAKTFEVLANSTFAVSDVPFSRSWH
jgi:hypothetical protein